MSVADEREQRELEEARAKRAHRRPPHGPGGPGPGGPGPVGAPGEKARDFKGTMGRIWRYVADHRAAIVCVVVCAVASCAAGVAGPAVLGMATTELFAGITAQVAGTGSIDLGRIGAILLAVLGIYLGSSLFNLVQGWVMAGVVQKVCYRLRADVAAKLERLPMSYFEKNATGDILSRVTNDVDTLGQGLSQTATQLVTSVVTVVGVVVVMVSISVPLTAVVLLTLPLTALVTMLVVRASQKHFRAQQQHLGAVDAQIEETFTGHTVVRAYGREQAVLEEFDRTNARLAEAGWKSQLLSGLMPPLTQLVGNLGYVGVAVGGAWLAARGSLAVGNIQAFMQYVRNFTQPLSQLAQVSNMLQSMAAAGERIFALLDEADEPVEVAGRPGTLAPAAVEGRVAFDHVRFSYVADKPVIRDFDCTVEPGQTVAIVGSTGAGKTTVVKLLMRFYDVDGGSIALDGRDVRDFDRAALRSQVGMVLQDTWLLKGTVRENIRYGRLDATDAEVEAAARAAFADHFIQALPGGYDTELNEDGSNISQGQRQLLTIARAVLADRPILILDEATSNVDTRTEERIQSAMDALMAGRTSFVIAHRLSTIKGADRILVMEAGDIVESGTHDDLLARGGVYARLYNKQFASIDEALGR
jgi:ATP-binding cassette subfamily B protein